MASSDSEEAAGKYIQEAATKEPGPEDRDKKGRLCQASEANYSGHVQTKRKVEGVSSSEPTLKKPGIAMSFGKAKAPSPASNAQTGKPSEFGISTILGNTSKVGHSGDKADGDSSGKKPPAPIKMTLGAQKVKESPTVKKASFSVAQAFQDDSDEEEMPAEARMRMRNRGRDTPTAAGPNSFGKSFLGFCDRRKILEKELQKQMDAVAEPE